MKNRLIRGDVRGPLTCAAFALSSAVLAAPTCAQDSVTVDLGAINAAALQLLVPEERGTTITLRPPPGVKPLTPSSNVIKLRPPPSMVKRTLPAPETTTAATPMPKEATSPPKAAPAPVAAPKPAPKPAGKPKETEVTKAPPVPAPAPAPTASAPKPTPITPQAKPVENEETAGEIETTALVEPNKIPSPPDEFTIPYGVGDADIPERANDNLRLLAARMAKNKSLRVEFIAFASDAENSVSRSRRLSLERAVNVRKMLLDLGVDSSQVNLRALGEQSGGGDPDRIDVIITTR